MKKFFSFFAALLFAGSMMAGSYTITFKDSGSGSDSNTGLTSTKIADYVAEGAEYLSAIAATGKVYNAQTGYGLKFGNSSNPGAVTLTLANSVKPTSIVMNASQYGASEGSGLLQDSTIDMTGGGGKGKFKDYTYEYDGKTDVTTIIVGTKSKRGYVKSVTVNFEGEAAPVTVANYCQTEITHAMNPAETASAVLLSVGVKGEKTIVRIDKKNAEAANLDFLQVTPNNVGSQLEEGGSEALAIEINTPTPVNDSLTLEILWSTVGFPGNWMVQNLRVAVADCQYATIPLVPMSCAEVYSTAKNDEVALKDVTVTYVNGSNVYVKDESGAMLLYLPTAATWKAGDKLAGVEGVVDVYHGLYEVKPSSDQVKAVVATAGDAPAPAELAVAPVAADVNKYVILKNVSVATGEFTTSKATNLDLTIGEAKVVLRNNFKIAQVFDGDAKYNIVGAVAVYDDAIQLYFISAEEIIVPQLNIMAYGLKAGDVADNKVTIDYKLNAKAKAVEIQLLNAEGTVVKTFEATGLKKGANQEVLDLDGVAAGTYNWAVKATGKTPETYVKVLEDKDIFGFWGPRGVAVDNSFESDYFGNIYVTNYNMNGGAGDVVTRATQTGVYALDAGLNPINENAYQGGVTFGGNSGIMWTIARPTVGPDGTVYVSTGAANNSGVWMMNPASPEVFAPVFGGTHTSTGTTKEGETVIHNSVMHCYVEGTGADRKLYTFDLADASAGGDILQYNIGELATPWVAGPSDTIYNDAKNGNKIQNGDCSIASDGNGGFWISQYRGGTGSEAIPALFHVTKNVIDYNAAATWPTNYQGGMAVSVDGKTLALGTDRSTVEILDIAYDANNVPTVTKKMTITWKESFTNHNAKGVAFDAANNLYVVDNNKEVGAIFAINAKTEFVTPARKANTIVVTDTGTAIDNSLVPVKAQKVIVNGQVLIIMDGKTYNMMGQIVK